MDARVLAVLRRPEGLFALVAARRAPFEPPLLGEGDPKPAPCPYTETLLPLADHPAADGVSRGLVGAWEAVRRVSVLNEQVAANVLGILACTLPDPLADSSVVGPLNLDDPPAQPRPTAAHPRAYRGTTYKPPKARQPRTVDLTPHLCVQADEARILARLAPLRGAALERVAKQWPEDVADVVRAHAAGALHPYGQSWSRAAAARIPTLPPGLRRYLLYGQRGRSWPRLARLLELWWGLELERNADLRLSVALALSRCPERECLEWCAVAAQIPARRRVQFMELLIETAAYRRPATPQTTSQVVEADRLCADRVWRHRMYAVLQAVAGKHELGYLLDGFRLGNEFTEPWSFPVSGPAGTAAAIRPWVAHIASGEHRESAKVWAVCCWRDCAQYEGLVDILLRVPPEALDPESASAFVSSLLIELEDEDEARRMAKWKWTASHAQRFFDQLTAVRPEYRAKLLSFLREFQRHFGVDDFDEFLPAFLVSTLRLCEPPFRVRGHSAMALAALLELSKQQPSLLDDTSRATWEQLEAAAFRRNEGWLIGAGLCTLAAEAARLMADGWARAPRAVLRTAKLLGSFRWAPRKALVRSFLTHAVCQVDPANAEWSAIWRCVHDQIEAGVPSPLSARLRACLEGKRMLTPAQLARDRALLQSRWAAFQWEVFRHCALVELGRGLDPPSLQELAIEHALRLQAEGDKNRRAVRELLRRRFGGQPDYADQHPLNRRWLAAHPRVDEGVWTRGVALREVGAEGSLDLRLEKDPLEVLRMGSYFGTCLGLGGIYTHSAAAVALDVNKQVVYARTPTGRVIARQLLAISEADELICFKVYPEDAGPGVRRLFREYDERFARKLGLRIYDETRAEAEYEIRNILSQDFWDDGAWNQRSRARKRDSS